MEFLDIYNIYIIGTAQMLSGFWRFNYFSEKSINSVFYILFTGISLIEIYLLNSLSYVLPLIYTLTLFVAGCFLFKISPARSALFSFIVNILMSIIYGITNCILAAADAPIQYENAVLISIIINFTAVIIFIVISIIIQKHLIYSESCNNVYTLVILTPVILIYLAELFINYNLFGNTTNSEANIVIIDFNPFQMLMTEILLSAVLFLILFIYKKLLENLTLNMRIENLKLEGKHLIRYAEETKGLYNKTRSFRHDVKNHLSVINLLLKEKKYEQALTYTNELIAGASALSYRIETGSTVLNVLLQNKLGYAESLDIDVKCGLALPKPCRIADLDLCTIISNAIDNAVDACMKLSEIVPKFIEIKSLIQDDIIIIKIKNSYDGKTKIKESTGIKNIKAAASKYNGLVEIEANSKEFTIKILLNLSQQEKDISQQNIY